MRVLLVLLLLVLGCSRQPATAPTLMQAICDASASARIAEILALNPGR